LDTAKNVLYVTDGSANLHTWHVPGDSETASVDGDGGNMEMMREVSPRVVVYKTLENGRMIPVENLNELEYDPYYATSTTVDDNRGGGTLLANVWQSDIILRINPETGHVTTIYDMTSLFPYSERPMSADVLNGIASIPDTNHPNEYWVTGKKWPYMFRVRLE
jgi:glutamine cyclotransferase